MKLTDGQLAAFTAFGLLLMYEEQTLLNSMTENELAELTAIVGNFVSPLISDDEDMVTPIVRVLVSTMLETFAHDMTKELTK